MRFAVHLHRLMDDSKLFQLNYVLEEVIFCFRVLFSSLAFTFALFLSRLLTFALSRKLFPDAANVDPSPFLSSFCFYCLGHVTAELLCSSFLFFSLVRCSDPIITWSHRWSCWCPVSPRHRPSCRGINRDTIIVGMINICCASLCCC